MIPLASSQTIRERVFGSKVQYICPLPLKDCLEQLQSKSDPKIPSIYNRYKVFITIIYVDRSKYRYLIHHQWNRNQVAYRNRVRGTLEQIDSQHTSVTIDATVSHLEQILFVILIVAGLVPFVLASGIPLLSLSGRGAEFFFGALVVGWAFDGLVLFSELRDRQRTLKTLIPRIYEALPPIL